MCDTVLGAVEVFCSLRESLIWYIWSKIWNLPTKITYEKIYSFVFSYYGIVYNICIIIQFLL